MPRKSRYIQIADDLTERICRYEWASGEKIPNEFALAEEYGCSRDTIRRALKRLENKNLIQRKPRLGTIVNFGKFEYPLQNMSSFSEQMLQEGKVPSSELLSLSFKAIEDLDVYRRLAIPYGQPLYAVERLRLADGKIMALEKTYVNPLHCPGLLDHITSSASMYKIYEEIYHLKLGEANITLEAELPTARVRELLNIKETSPILKMHCLLCLENKSPLYYVICQYIGDKYQFAIKLRR